MFLLKRIIIGFWALWWTLAFLTDFLGGLYLLNLFTASWVPHSNYPALVTSLAQYHVPNWLPAVFFCRNYRLVFGLRAGVYCCSAHPAATFATLACKSQCSLYNFFELVVWISYRRSGGYDVRSRAKSYGAGWLSAADIYRYLSFAR